jgi:hypothetical protein
MRQATASYSRLVREMAVKKSPETEASVMATRDSRPVREEVVDKVSVQPSSNPRPLQGILPHVGIYYGITFPHVGGVSSHLGGTVTWPDRPPSSGVKFVEG